jgi:hypothetical protein
MSGSTSNGLSAKTAKDLAKTLQSLGLARSVYGICATVARESGFEGPRVLILRRIAGLFDEKERA